MSFKPEIFGTAKVVVCEEDGDYFARVTRLDTMGDGKSKEKAIEHLEEMLGHHLSYIAQIIVNEGPDRVETICTENIDDEDHVVSMHDVQLLIASVLPAEAEDISGVKISPIESLPDRIHEQRETQIQCRIMFSENR